MEQPKVIYIYMSEQIIYLANDALRSETYVMYLCYARSRSYESASKKLGMRVGKWRRKG